MITTYLYTKSLSSELISHIKELYGNIVLEKYDEEVLKIIVDEYDVDTTLGMKENFMADFYLNPSVFIAPKLLSEEITFEIIQFIKNLKSDLYKISDIIIQAFMKNRKIIKDLKQYYENLFHTETIETVLGFLENDSSASKTADKMFMHRNTVNYRIDNFVSTTGINIRKFKEGVSIYLLLKY